jgi:hypothetical protein
MLEWALFGTHVEIRKSFDEYFTKSPKQRSNIEKRNKTIFRSILVKKSKRAYVVY